VTDHTITALLADVRAGAHGALDRLVALLYDDLRRLAAAHMARDRTAPTMQPTAVVHELYFKLLEQNRIAWQDRTHFMATAALLMRRLLVDMARRRRALKRGGGEVVTLDTDLDIAEDRSADVVRVHDVLEELAALDPRQARVVELRFFGGLTFEDVAKVLG
jgi:RNA polymerase sigma factor (TIGR02999 family)